MDVAEQRRLADENLVVAFALVAERFGHPRGGSARFGAVHAIVSGNDSAFFNPVLVLDPAAVPPDVEMAVEWARSREVQVSVQVRDDLDPRLRGAAESLGLTTDGSPTPVMVLEPIPTGRAPDPPIAGVEVQTGGAELLDAWHTALEGGERFRRLFGPAFGGDPSVRLAVGFLDGVPVSAAAAVRSAATLGIYAVGTIERARRRGLGRAVTWAAIEAGRAAWDSRIAILQSSEMGRPLYELMGFVVVSGYLEFSPPAP